MKLEAQWGQDEWAVPSWLHGVPAAGVVGGAEEAEASRISTALREVNTKLVQQKRALAEALERQAAKRAAAVPVNNQRPA